MIAKAKCNVNNLITNLIITFKELFLDLTFKHALEGKQVTGTLRSFLMNLSKVVEDRDWDHALYRIVFNSA